MKILSALSIVLFVSNMGCAQPIDPVSLINLPDGFEISVYCDQVPGARSLALSPSGTLFIGTRNEGKVYAVQDLDGDKRAETVHLIASGLNMPNGVAIAEGSLYVAEVNRLLRYNRIEQHLNSPPLPEVIHDSLPKERHHGWKYIAFGPDGMLYVPVGAPCNICEVVAPFASLIRMRPDGSGQEIFASGIRNTVGFDWHPETGDLWFTDNGRDWLGDNLPPDELNAVFDTGLHFGFPYVHGTSVIDPEFGKKGKGVSKIPPVLEFQAHVAPLGVQFYNGNSFPEKYWGHIFIAQHGSWNRSTKVGYRVVTVFVQGTRVVGQQVFADGWLNNGQVHGRPVDLEILADGSLLVSDDKAGKIYRISYKNPLGSSR